MDATEGVGASGDKIVAGKDLDMDGKVRLEIVEDHGQNAPVLSFRIRATVVLSPGEIQALLAALRGDPGTRTPRQVIESSGAASSPDFDPHFARMTPDGPAPTVVTEGTGGVPNFLITTDMRMRKPRYLFTIHTEIFLLDGVSASDLADAIDGGKPDDLLRFLLDNGDSVNKGALSSLLNAAIG